MLRLLTIIPLGIMVKSAIMVKSRLQIGYPCLTIIVQLRYLYYTIINACMLFFDLNNSYIKRTIIFIGSYFHCLI